MTAPALRIVETPEDELRRLFDAEDAMIAELAEIRQAQNDARKRYADKHGLLVRPSMATIRKALEL
jgi:hypothetical protein